MASPVGRIEYERDNPRFDVVAPVLAHLVERGDFRHGHQRIWSEHLGHAVFESGSGDVVQDIPGAQQPHPLTAQALGECLDQPWQRLNHLPLLARELLTAAAQGGVDLPLVDLATGGRRA
jgi:hypothetical protein